MSKLSGVEDTLYIPLTARIYISEHFPDYFFDEAALALKPEMPYDEIVAKQSEYFAFAGAARFRIVDDMVRNFIAEHSPCNIVNLGCGLETLYFRVKPAPGSATFFEQYLSDVIETRRAVLGEHIDERLLGGDLFDFGWADEVDASLPTFITVIGVLQYFDDERVRGFLAEAKRRFSGANIVFDAMTHKAIKYANDYIKKTGNADAELGFGIDDPAQFARECDIDLVEARPFFTEARKLKGLKLYTRIAMKVVDEGGRRGFLMHAKL
ncbi:MAG: class I SAM-dependent methyltransferase [Eggerthellaceae bacterium]|nr:class I SAM-dependent methyltransferase [Eggerthellaceae bacterium]